MESIIPIIPTPKPEETVTTSGNTDDNFISEDLIENKEYYNQLSESEMLSCSICLGLLNDPIMCESCQNSFCKKCLIDWQKKHLCCPFKCQTLKFIPISRTLRTLLDTLIINCDCGCGQKISLLKYPKHKEENKKIECFNCGAKIFKANLKIPIEKSELSKKNFLNISPKMLKAFNSKISFLIYVEANNIKGFITCRDGELYMTKYKPEANYFSVFYKNGQKFLQVFLDSRGWVFVEPHYDRGVLYGSNKATDSINFDFENGTITSNSGKTNKFPLTLRIWDYKFYFFNKNLDEYIPVSVKMVPYEVYNS